MSNTKNIELAKNMINTIAGATGSKEVINMKDDNKFKNLNALDDEIMEKDLEAGLKDSKPIDVKYELEFEGDIKTESINKDFDHGIFDKIGLAYNKTNHTVILDFNAYSNTGDKKSGNFLQHFTPEDQLKIIAMYFEIESLRYTNQKMYEFSNKHKKTFNILYVVAMVLNIVIPYLPDLVGYANKSFEQYSVYFAGASAIITFISYFFTRALMSTTANQGYFDNMQVALIKLRFAVETVIMGSYHKVPTSEIKTTVVTYNKLEACELSEEALGQWLTTFLSDIKTDLESIYQTKTTTDIAKSAFKDKNAQTFLDNATKESKIILKAFETEINKAVIKIKENQALMTAANTALIIAKEKMAENENKAIIKF
jgi:hypothetical protein